MDDSAERNYQQELHADLVNKGIPSLILEGISNEIVDSEDTLRCGPPSLLHVHTEPDDETCGCGKRK